MSREECLEVHDVRIYMGEECSIEYLRDLCECIRVTVRIYRIIDIRHCTLSCMDGNILTK